MKLHQLQDINKLLKGFHPFIEDLALLQRKTPNYLVQTREKKKRVFVQTSIYENTDHINITVDKQMQNYISNYIYKKVEKYNETGSHNLQPWIFKPILMFRFTSIRYI